ncbi:hypothetical protein BDZ88DRAFT_410024 [Geranomyces variabilis]|nr:hypothetical protein BDZ88DRAFT_410024 [Geranomyces variabilis]
MRCVQSTQGKKVTQITGIWQAVRLWAGNMASLPSHLASQNLSPKRVSLQSIPFFTGKHHISNILRIMVQVPTLEYVGASWPAPSGSRPVRFRGADAVVRLFMSEPADEFDSSSRDCCSMRRCWALMRTGHLTLTDGTSWSWKWRLGPSGCAMRRAWSPCPTYLESLSMKVVVLLQTVDLVFLKSAQRLAKAGSVIWHLNENLRP